MFCYILCFLILFSNIVFASVTKEQANLLYNKAISNSSTYEDATKAEDAFELLNKESPSFYNKIRLATLLALKAKHSSIFKRKELAEESIKAFDELKPYIEKSESVEEIYEFHFFRGRTYINFPSFMGKSEIASQDLHTAVRMVQKGLVVRPKAEVARLYLSFGKLLINDGNRSEGTTFLQEALDTNTLDEEDIKFVKKYIK